MKNKLRLGLSQVPPGSRITAAVSGGMDSMALLHGLLALSQELALRVSAVHFHHGIRGEEADRDEAFIRAWCSAHSVPLNVGRGDAVALSRQAGIGLEEAARDLRYRFFETLDTDYIATAHTADDNAETVLCRLVRGTGLHGLTGIPPLRERLIRPMLQISRREIEAYMQENQIPHVEDSTNALDDNIRNRLRHQVMPLLTGENPAFVSSVAAMTASLRLEDNYLEAQASEALAAISDQRGLSCPDFAPLHPAIQYRILCRLLAPVPDLNRSHLDGARAFCLQGGASGTLNLPGSWKLLLEYGRVRLVSAGAPESAPAETQIFPGQTVSFGPFLVTCTRGPRPKILPQGIIALSPSPDCPLTLRTRRPGDIIHLPGGTKKLSRLMIDKKIPARLRPFLPVVVRDNTVLAVLPLVPSAEARTRAGQDSLMLSVIEREESQCFRT